MVQDRCGGHRTVRHRRRIHRQHRSGVAGDAGSQAGPEQLLQPVHDRLFAAERHRSRGRRHLGTQWWYPYPFLDPHNAGYGSTSAYIAVMLVAFVAIGAIIIAIGRYREKRAAVRGSAPSARGALHV